VAAEDALYVTVTNSLLSLSLKNDAFSFPKATDVHFSLPLTTCSFLLVHTTAWRRKLPAIGSSCLEQLSTLSNWKVRPTFHPFACRQMVEISFRRFIFSGSKIGKCRKLFGDGNDGKPED